MNTVWIIKDWAGNVLNHNGRFQRASDAVPMTFKEFDMCSDWLCDRFGHLDDTEYAETVEEFYFETVTKE